MSPPVNNTMRALSAAEVMNVWEAGLDSGPTDRALALLALAYPGTPRETLAALSIGQRDATLLALRQKLYGPEMAAVVVCSGCGDQLELNLDTRQMLSEVPTSQSADLSLSVAGYNVTFRPPSSLDMLAITEHTSIEGCQTLVLERCLISAQHGGAPVGLGNLPPEVLASISTKMAEADPLANIQLDLTCPACKHRWDIVFDIVSFFWTELEVWAWRMLSDIHILASAYGWCEREILNLSPTRRQFYLEMVGA